MENKLEEYLKRPYTRILIPDETNSYSAEILEFPGCFAEGKTPDEAIENLNEVAKSWIEASLEQGQEIPEPFMNQGYGGKIALRLPKSLHRQAVRMAERDGVSLNQFLISAIATRVGIEDFYSHLLEKLLLQAKDRITFYQFWENKTKVNTFGLEENFFKRCISPVRILPQTAHNEVK